MHRNTFLVIAVLAVVAALVVGVNLGRRQIVSPTTTNQLSPTPSPPLPVAKLLEYTNSYCGISFQYPATLTKVEGASGSAILVNQAQAAESVTLICQKDIPQLTGDRVDLLTLSDATGASVTAKLYHKVATEPGILSDKLIFRHPRTELIVLLAGAGATFDQILQTVRLLP